MFPLLIGEFNEISKLINIIDIFRNFKEISDSNASTGRALQLNISGKMMISHFIIQSCQADTKFSGDYAL
jgi:hypothetical protein